MNIRKRTGLFSLSTLSFLFDFLGVQNLTYIAAVPYAFPLAVHYLDV